MRIFLACALLTAAPACSSDKDASASEEEAAETSEGGTPREDTPESETAAQVSSGLTVLPIDEAGNRYVIDETTRACFLVIKDAGGSIAPARVSCRRLKENLPEAREHLSWLSESRKRRSPSRAERNEMKSALKDGVRRVGDDTWEISGEALEKALEKPSDIARAARIVPSVEDGEPNGFKLYAIRPGSFYEALGFQNGDLVRSVNGKPLTSPDRALAIYEQLRKKDEFAVSLTRRAQELEHTYRIAR